MALATRGRVVKLAIAENNGMTNLSRNDVRIIKLQNDKVTKGLTCGLRYRSMPVQMRLTKRSGHPTRWILSRSEVSPLHGYCLSAVEYTLTLLNKTLLCMKVQ